MSRAALNAVRRGSCVQVQGLLQWRVLQAQEQGQLRKFRALGGDGHFLAGESGLRDFQGWEGRICTAGAHSRAGEEAASSSSSSSTGSESGSVGDESFVGKVGKGLTAATSTAAEALKKVKDAKFLNVAKDGYSFLKEELTSTGPRKRPPAAPAPEVAPDTTATAVVVVKEKKSAWEAKWDEVKEKAQAHPFYRRLSSMKKHPVITKGEEIAEDMRERWETSDSEFVHKLQDLNESVFGETATAMAMKEIRRRDPTFSYADFIAEVQQSIRPLLQAYLKGDTEALKRRCSEGVLVRCGAETRALQSMGIYLDNKILHVSEVQVKETKLLGNEPVIIVSFHTQQINCARDQTGKIVEGARDDIHTVFYLWALQHVAPEDMHTQDSARWQLREMQKLGMQALI